MSFATSTSLGFSDGMSRHSSSLLKHTNGRISKQDIHAKRMFGNKKSSHGKDFKVGSKMFRKKGKGVMHGSTTGEKHGGISPSIEEFDSMLAEAGGGKKKKMFSRKQFG